MQLIDLSHSIGVDDAVFPGTPPMSYAQSHSIAKDHYNLGVASVNTHAGTHTDAPLHFVAGGNSLGEVELQRYVGPAAVLDLRAKGSFDVIDVADAKPYEQTIRAAKRVLMCTGWDRQFGKDAFYTDYPMITLELAQYLVSLGVVMIGVEPPSLNQALYIEVHEAFLKADVAIVESLTHLDQLIGKDFIFCGAPLRFRGMDGFPVRAFAILQ